MAGNPLAFVRVAAGVFGPLAGGSLSNMASSRQAGHKPWGAFALNARRHLGQRSVRGMESYRDPALPMADTHGQRRIAGMGCGTVSEPRESRSMFTYGFWPNPWNLAVRLFFYLRLCDATNL